MWTVTPNGIKRLQILRYGKLLSDLAASFCDTTRLAVPLQIIDTKATDLDNFLI